jgi:hypothetical protein
MDLKKFSSLSRDEQRILRDQVIDEHRPGTILADFQTLLEFIGNAGLIVSGKHNLLPLGLLSQLNARLGRPMAIGLERPQQKSYPNLNGLYLLLRATGLAYVKAAGTKPLLFLDEEVFPGWRSLNPTERYFTLLEAWLLHSRIEVLGEYRDPQGPLLRCVEFLGRVPQTGIQLAGNKQMQQSITYFPGLPNLALLDLFGLVALEPGQPEAGKGWTIASVRRLPFGDALLKYVFQLRCSENDSLDFILEGESPAEVVFGQLQPALRPFFPEWRNNLVLPKTDFREGTYIFKVSLGKTWRQIGIPGQKTLDNLSAIILRVFEFEETDHLYRFIYKNRFGTLTEVNHPYVEEPPFTSEVRIGELPLQVGASMTYNFDFGEDWRFDVKLERIDPTDLKIKKPILIASHGKAPRQYPDWDEEEDY